MSGVPHVFCYDAIIKKINYSFDFDFWVEIRMEVEFFLPILEKEGEVIQ